MENSTTPIKSSRRFYHPTLKKISILMIIIGVAVIMYVPATWLWGWWEQRGLADQFSQVERPDIEFTTESVPEQLRQLALAFKEDLSTEKTIALLQIPRIGVNSIVVEGTEESSLRKGPGHMEETPLPGMGGNFSVAGDRVLYGGPFLNLDELENGDEIIVKMPYGVFTYNVTNKFITVPDDLTIIDPGNAEMITLITCDPPWDTSHRLVIQATATFAELIEPTDRRAES